MNTEHNRVVVCSLEGVSLARICACLNPGLVMPGSTGTSIVSCQSIDPTSVPSSQTSYVPRRNSLPTPSRVSLRVAATFCALSM